MVCFLWGRMRALRVPKRLGRLGSVPNDCGTRCGTKSSFNSAPWINYFRRITKHGLCGNTSAASTCRSCGSRFKPSEGGPGQAPADPRILVALWLYATLRGVGSARGMNHLCQYHAAYRWLCGGVSMNYHTLADFRTQHVDLLDRLLTESAASLMAEGLVTLDRVAQDG